MSTTEQLNYQAASASPVAVSPHVSLVIPPNFFAIPLGIAGLAGVWRLAGSLYRFPAAISGALYLVATAVYVFLLALFAIKLVRWPTTVRRELTHPVLGPFYALLPITGMVLTTGLEPYAPVAAVVLFGVWFSIAVLFGGWITGQWIVTQLEADTVHPGYFLPTVAASFVAADSAAHLGMIGLGWVSFGIGLISWFTLGAIIMNRLMLRPNLPPALTPTLAIQVAPAVVAGNAYFALTAGKVDMGAYLLAGYAVLMVLVQLRLAPSYLKMPFAPSFWTFTFSYAAVTANALRWITIEQIGGGMLLGYLLLAAITALIGGIAIRSLIELWHGRFLPTG